MIQPPRTIAVGDIHGCSAALDALLAVLDLRPDDTLVTLGDTIDRGLDSRGVLDRLIALKDHCRLVPLMGNHDRMLLDALADRDGRAHALWRACGGIATLQSYGDVDDPGEIPAEHIRFLRSCRLSFETETHLFVHANYQADRPLAGQHEGILLWESLRDTEPGPHFSGKAAVVGHSSQKSGEVLDLGYLKCIDTYCYGGKWLTALDVGSGQLWQADARGRMRR
jgi:serine/threonine protein phosphatase 1